MALILKRPVVVRQVVTETFKQRTLQEIDESLRQIGESLERLEFQARRLVAEVERERPAQAAQLRERLQEERRRQEAVRRELLAKREEVLRLELDSLYTVGTYDTPVQLEVGDRFSEKMRRAEVLVRDDVVVAIRE
ncbi:MAG: hypothetical protein KatS3mg115_1519 [Candidatus Poribacteria bacterium]|nr:MAG: hypothetical protein KatS3mg115_1519 [Candidatus Poribacteria bacterium]